MIPRGMMEAALTYEFESRIMHYNVANEMKPLLLLLLFNVDTNCEMQQRNGDVRHSSLKLVG